MSRNKQVFVALSRDAIKQAPEYGDEIRLTRDYEATLYRHHRYQGYWTNDLPPTKLRR
jgi:hypothetical protein